MPAIKRTHCVTFLYQGDRYYAVKSHNYGDPIPTGITQPETRCAMSQRDAVRLAQVMVDAKFSNVKVNELQLKRKVK